MKNKIYLASALFTVAEQDYNILLGAALKDKGYSVFLPQIACKGLQSPQDIFNMCKQGIDGSDILVVNMEGVDVDSGTAWECGYAYACSKPIIGLRTDFRQRGDDKGLNLMLSQSAELIIYEQDFDTLIKKTIHAINRCKGGEVR